MPPPSLALGRLRLVAALYSAFTAGALAAAPVVLELDVRVRDAPPARRRVSDEAWLYGNLHQLRAYHVDVLIGTPGQLQSLIVDTGSSTTAFPCQGCGLACGEHLDEPFDPQASSTFRWLGCGDAGCDRCENSACGYDVRYVEGSRIHGQLFEDVLHIGQGVRSNGRSSVVLGCHKLETNLFKEQVPSGIMGLGQRSHDAIQALAGGHVEREVFALCLADGGGVMTVGDVNLTWAYPLQPAQWVSYTSTYKVVVTGVAVIDRSSGSTTRVHIQGDFSVDSGSTFSYFTEAQNQDLRRAVDTACSSSSRACGGATRVSWDCWQLEGDDASLLDGFPALELSLGGGVVPAEGKVLYSWTAQGYLFRADDSLFCYAFGGEPPLTLGASFMKHHLVVFDRESRSIGFAPSDCPSIQSRSDHGDEPAGESASGGNVTNASAFNLQQGILRGSSNSGSSSATEAVWHSSVMTLTYLVVCIRTALLL